MTAVQESGQPAVTTTAEIGGIGHSVKRIEDDRFTAGQGNYLDDHSLPGMLHMAILRSPVAHARIRSIDEKTCRTMPSRSMTKVMRSGMKPSILVTP